MSLIAAGASVHMPDQFGLTILKYALIKRNTEICKSLLSAGAIVNPSDEEMITPEMRS